MNSVHPLLRRVRSILADQERALRATSLAQSSRCATPEIRALYTRHVDETAGGMPARVRDEDLSVSPAGPVTAS